MTWQFPALFHLPLGWHIAPPQFSQAGLLFAFKRYSTDEPVSFFAPMSQILFWLMVCGIVTFFVGFRWLRYERRIQDTPFSKMGSASVGLVEVSGCATGPRTITAALTGAKCLYYRAIVWQRHRAGNDSNWQQIADESTSVPFFVEDNTGKLYVQPQGAQMEVRETFKQEYDARIYRGPESWPEPIRSFLARTGVDGSKDLRLEEHCIKPGETLFVMGTLGEPQGVLSWDSQPHFGKKQSLRVQLSGPIVRTSNTAWKIIKTPGTGDHWTALDSGSAKSGDLDANMVKQLLDGMVSTGDTKSVSVKRFTVNKPGGASTSVLAEVQGATSPAMLPQEVFDEITRMTGGAITGQQIREAMQQTGAAATNDGEEGAQQRDTQPLPLPKVAIRAGRRGDPFIISWKSQREVAGELHRRAMICILAGPAMAVASLYFLLMLLGKIGVGG